MKPLGIVFLAISQLIIPVLAGQQQSTPLQNQASAARTTPVPVEAPSASDTAKWKIYRNEKHGFEVKYPETWNVHAGSGIGPEITAIDKPLRAGEPNASLTLAIQSNQNPKKQSIEEWFAEHLRMANAKPEASGRMVIGGQPAVFMENTNSFGTRHDIFTLLHETDVLSLSYTRQPQFDPICAAMAASFRLVK